MDKIDYLLLDLRSEENYSKGHIDRAQQLQLDSNLKDSIFMPDNREVLVFYDEGVISSEKLDWIEKTLFPALRGFYGNEFFDQKIRKLVLDGGYFGFRNEFPFLCTDSAHYEQDLIYPSLIEPDLFISSQVLQNLF